MYPSGTEFAKFDSDNIKFTELLGIMTEFALTKCGGGEEG
jgi:hypothetical protein